MVKFLIEKFNKEILKSPVFIAFVVVILAQLILVSIIFFQSREIRGLSQKVDYNVMAMREDKAGLEAKIDAVQNSVMRVLAQLYRMQGTGEGE